ncbi:helix-turn-helix domain-containing protein [Pseudodesulfovibrio tunisiensis]|uniref:helix-turn-helix domain-containing protein n=1 Tax=Pseudodesulfovibrio tunisiensis TaxID=463192 RepID=UPI001FB52A93|nr:AraC family transcriptional regulator [Pseudodesulfovibrio tunisiensis]
MQHQYPTHSSDFFADQSVPFAIHPFSKGTGCPVTDVDELHLNDFHVIHYVVGGGGQYLVDFESHDIQPNSLYFVSPGQLHFWRPDNELDGFVLLFAEEFLLAPDAPVGSRFELRFFHGPARTSRFPVPRDQAGIIEDLFRRMQNEFHAGKAGYASVVRAFFHVLMVHLQRMASESRGLNDLGREPVLVRRFRRLVGENFAAQRTVQEYARDLGVSVSSLNNTVRESTGLTPARMVRDELVLAAKRLLAHSDKGVAEICFELNFEDPSYFGRFFRRETGLTPSAFRENLRQKYHHFVR